MAARIPNQNYVRYYDPALKHHRDWLLAVLDELTILNPEILSEGYLRELWAKPAPVPKPPAAPAVPHRDRWLRVIRYAEGTLGKDGYRVTFSYGKPIELDRPHPARVNVSNGYRSDASGAYQFLSTTWKDIANPRGSNPIMSVANQDAAAAALARRRGVDIDTALFTRENVAKLAPEWASLPALNGKSFYDQPVKAFTELETVFRSNSPLPRPQASTRPAALASRIDPGLPRGAAEDGRFGVMAGPKKRADLQSGDAYLVVNGPARECRAYDHTGRPLWTAPALCVGQGRDWRVHRGDTPAGLYRVGEVYRDYERNPSPPNTETARAYGWYSFDLVDLEGQESDNGRAGIMIHGGGSAAGWPGAWAPLQPLHPTLGCIRMHNQNLEEVDKLVRGGRVFVGVWQRAVA